MKIICLRPPYIPRKDTNICPDAPKRLLDCLFRQTRQDNIEIIIDTCYDGLQKAIWPSVPIYNYRQETPQGNRYSFLQDVKFESLMFNEFVGAIFRVSFECPYKLRGQALLSSSLLERSKTCALLAIHDETKEINILLFEIYQRETTVGSESRFCYKILIRLDCFEAHWLDFSRWRATDACR